MSAITNHETIHSSENRSSLEDVSTHLGWLHPKISALAGAIFASGFLGMPVLSLTKWGFSLYTGSLLLIPCMAISGLLFLWIYSFEIKYNEIIKTILEKRLDTPIDVNNTLDQALYEFCIQGGSRAPRAVQILINKGANVNVRDEKSNITPLHVAFASGSFDVAQVLIDNGADVNAKNICGQTPRDFASVGRLRKYFRYSGYSYLSIYLHPRKKPRDNARG